MPLLLSALWLTTAGVIYNPGGAWLHDKVNSRRWMFMTGFIGITFVTSCLAAMIACFAGTDNKAGNAMGVVFMFLYLTFQGTFCDTTMYTYISEIFPTEIRSIGMGWSLFGQFAGKYRHDQPRTSRDLTESMHRQLPSFCSRRPHSGLLLWVGNISC